MEYKPVCSSYGDQVLYSGRELLFLILLVYVTFYCKMFVSEIMIVQKLKLLENNGFNHFINILILLLTCEFRLPLIIGA